MKPYLLIALPAALLLSSPMPPPVSAVARPVRSEPQLAYAELECAGPCDDLAVPELVIEPVPPPSAALQAAPEPEPRWSGGAVRVVVSIPQQRAYVFRGAELVATSRVSTGKRGHATPVGTFRILQKKVKHHSNLYANAPMPYMQRLTHGGVALHAGHVPGYPASHGCIRLPWSFARKLYDMTNFDTMVTVTKARPKSAKDALDYA